MRAVVCQGSRLETAEVADPVPERGHLLVEVTGCGICGSDLHAVHHADEQAAMLAEVGYDGFMRSDQAVVLGHELVGQVVDHGPGAATKAFPTGTTVVALPLIERPTGMHPVGLSAEAPGGYAERVLVQESFAFPVPDGLGRDVAVLTEPMAIAWHAVRRSEIARRDVAVVVGCGPVGLAVICMLKARKVGTVIASDPSAARRGLAFACGADVVVDPTAGSPYEAAAEQGFVTSMSAGAKGTLRAIQSLERLPIAWHHVWRLAEKAGKGPGRPIVFECVGRPGMIDSIITDAPLGSRVVVVGVCAESDAIRPAMAINKQIDLRFVVGYSPLEFRDTLRMLAEGKVAAEPLVTGHVGLDGVSAAFDALSQPEVHAKIVIDPRQQTAAANPIRLVDQVPVAASVNGDRP